MYGSVIFILYNGKLITLFIIESHIDEYLPKVDTEDSSSSPQSEISWDDG